jgi:pyrroline-5-carboxylate reductase
MKITFLGGGNMANALIGGMLKQGFAGNRHHVIDPGAEARAKLTAGLRGQLPRQRPMLHQRR